MIQPEVFDQPDFNAVEFLNRQFPDENSLQHLDAYRAQLQRMIDDVDRQLLKAVQSQAVAGDKVEQDMQLAKDVMKDLFTKIRDIKHKAEQSELMVQEICRDIRPLDNAKRNLTLSIKHLRRLQMLEDAISRLMQETSSGNLREAAQLLDASEQLLTHFDSHRGVPKVQLMVSQVSELRAGLRHNVFQNFEINLERDLPANLSDACAVLAVLGDDIRKEFVNIFIQNHLEMYRRKFHRGEESAMLKNTDKRFRWFRRLLTVYEEKLGAIFPTAWNVPQELAVEFCILTNSELKFQLEAEAKTMDAVVLVKSLQATIDFEKELTRKWKPVEVQSAENHSSGSDDMTAAAASAAEGDVTSANVERIKSKYRRQAAHKQKESGDGAPRNMTVKQYRFYGFLTTAFEGSMKLYVDFQEREMADIVDSLVAQETWGKRKVGDVDSSGAAAAAEDEEEDSYRSTSEILTSASDLMIYVGERLKSCSKLSKGQTLAAMCEVWRKHLNTYCSKLLAALPSKPQEKDDQMVALVVNTAEYWYTSVDQLTSEVKSIIDELYRDQITFEAVSGAFSRLINKGVRTLMRGIEAAVEANFTEMVRINWAQVSDAGDESAYLVSLCQAAADRVASVARFLNPTYLRFLCDKLSVSMVQKFLQQLYKCKRISDGGCKQLFLDAQYLKSSLIALPNSGCPSRYTAAALESHGKIVVQEMKKPELVLKLLLTPLTSDTTLPLQYAELHSRPSIPDFLRIMELKGLKKADSQGMVDFLLAIPKVAKVEPPVAEEEEDTESPGRDLPFLNDWRKKLEEIGIKAMGK